MARPQPPRLPLCWSEHAMLPGVPQAGWMGSNLEQDLVGGPLRGAVSPFVLHRWDRQRGCIWGGRRLTHPLQDGSHGAARRRTGCPSSATCRAHVLLYDIQLLSQPLTQALWHRHTRILIHVSCQDGHAGQLAVICFSDADRGSLAGTTPVWILLFHGCGARILARIPKRCVPLAWGPPGEGIDPHCMPLWSPTSQSQTS
jgi:hypothetical protein